jgi:hypothetical protein
VPAEAEQDHALLAGLLGGERLVDRRADRVRGLGRRDDPLRAREVQRRGERLVLAVGARLDQGLIEAIALPQTPVFEAAIQFARTEGIVPAPESAHAIRAAIDEALRGKASGEPKTILFLLSGHGNFDMGAYDAYFSGRLTDYEHPQSEIDAALAGLPRVGA